MDARSHSSTNILNNFVFYISSNWMWKFETVILQAWAPSLTFELLCMFPSLSLITRVSTKVCSSYFTGDEWHEQKGDWLIILEAKVARAGNQHHTHVLQRALDDVHVLIQVAWWRLGGIRQEGIFKVHAQGLREVVVPKSQTTLQDSKLGRNFQDWILLAFWSRTHGADVHFDDRNERAPRRWGVCTLRFNVHTNKESEDTIPFTSPEMVQVLMTMVIFSC